MNIKSQLKRIFKRFLPEQVIKRKKIGFQVPLKKIFKFQTLCSWREDISRFQFFCVKYNF